jgi:hypothetical protein
MLRRVCSSRFIIAVSIVSLLAGLFGTSNTPAQTTSGTIVGYVKDKAGKGIPEALVTIINEENGRNRAALADENGYYVRVNLPPGTYRLVASKAGYIDQVVAHFPVQFNQKNLVKAPEFTLPKVTLRGNVVDRVNNSLPGARVVAANEQYGDTREAVTGQRGDYSIPELGPGTYRIYASWSGGQAVSIAIALEREDERAPSIKLIDVLSDSQNPPQSPAPPQSTNGEEVAALVRATDIARASNFTEQQVQSLPLGGTTYMRTFDELALLVAGVAPPPYTPGARGPGVGFGVGSAGQFSVNGMRARSNNFSVDGSDNNDPDVGVRRQGFVALVPQSIESIKEVSLSTLLWDSELGRNFGAQVNAVSRYGGNQYHGQLYGFFTDSSLNARNFFDYTGGPSGGENPFTRTQAGFVLGGPITRVSSQFFASFEHQDVNASTEHHFSTPTLAERSLTNFLGRLLGGTPGTFRVVHPVPDLPPNSFFDPAPGVVTTSLGGNVLSLYPLPNNAGGPFGANTFTEVLPSNGDGWIASIKLTHQLNVNHSIDARYNFTNDNRVLPSVNRAIRSTIEADTRTQNLSLVFESTLSRRVFNLARFSYGRTRLAFPLYPNNPLTFEAESNVLVSGSVETSRTGPIGELDIEPFSPVGINDYTFPQGSINNTFQYADSLSWTLGDHSVKFGGDIRHFQLDSFQDRLYRPLVVYGNGAIALGKFKLTPLDNFPGRFKQKSETLPLPGVALATIGLPSSVFQTITLSPPDSKIQLRSSEFGLFVNDTWRARPNLTLDYGVRYEYNTVPRDADNRLERALRLEGIPSPGGSRFNSPERTQAFNVAVEAYSRVLAGRTRMYDPDRNNLAPHLGFAWDPWSDGKTAIRAGYGIYYDTILGAVVSQSRNVFPTETPVNIGLEFDVLNLNNPSFTNIGQPPVFLVRPGSGNQFGGGSQDFVAFIGSLLLQNLNGGGLALTLPEKKLRTPYAQQWHFTIEREVLGEYSVSAAYVGTRGTKLTRLTTPNLGPNVTTLVPVGLAIDFGLVTIPFGPAVAADASRNLQRARPIAGLGAIQIFENSASSSYHALQLEARKRHNRGFSFTAAYTWSHALDDVSDVFPIAGAPILPQDSFDLKAEHGDANFDVRHRFAGSLIWDVPFYQHSRNGAARLLSGWQLASMFQAQTGQPFTLGVPFDANLDGNLTDRPSTTDGLIFLKGHGAQRIALAPGGEAADFFSFGKNGAVPRNTARGDSFVNVDISLSKTFRLSERQDIRFRSEFFNVMNRANFGLPVRLIGAPGFGSAVETATPARTIQFALKYSF